MRPLENVSTQKGYGLSYLKPIILATFCDKLSYKVFEFPITFWRLEMVSFTFFSSPKRERERATPKKNELKM